MDEDVAHEGEVVSVLWGEPDGGSSRPTVERHIQTEIRATVTSCPISTDVRDNYRQWSS